MPRPKRQNPPVGVKLKVALRELGLEGVPIEWDHEPALGLRPVDPETGDTIPPANDPAHIQILLIDEHGEKTKLDRALIDGAKRMAGETGQRARRERRGGSSIQGRGFETNRDGKWKAKINARTEERT